MPEKKNPIDVPDDEEEMTNITIVSPQVQDEDKNADEPMPDEPREEEDMEDVHVEAPIVESKKGANKKKQVEQDDDSSSSSNSSFEVTKESDDDDSDDHSSENEDNHSNASSQDLLHMDEPNGDEKKDNTDEQIKTEEELDATLQSQQEDLVPTIYIARYKPVFPRIPPDGIPRVPQCLYLNLLLSLCSFLEQCRFSIGSILASKYHAPCSHVLRFPSNCPAYSHFESIRYHGAVPIRGMQ